ncbi:MAG: Zn-dependent hydrolase [Proteobacteria bacterium]|nr:Zn-dependent hydrolase [Pseudomonadota bacterium]
MPSPGIAIDGERLWRSLMTLAEIGRTQKGGVGRLALTDLDREARDLFAGWCRDAGCTVTVDAIGNVIARRPGRDPSRAPVATGSHLDSQPLGGRFDGAYGVMAGLEVVRALNDAGIETAAPIEVIDWTDEEGARFAAGCIGSAVFAGIRPLEQALALTDADGKMLGDELRRIGYAGNAAPARPLAAYFEAHIEQGPILEKNAVPIGAVLGAQGQRCFMVTVTGVEGHAGTLPMTERRDAFVGAAKMAVALNELAFSYQPNPVITVGHVRVGPNSRNTIPGTTVFSIDSRHPDEAILQRMQSDMVCMIEGIADDIGLGIAIETVTISAPVHFDLSCVEAVREAAGTLGIPCQDIYSGAGHDACKVAAVAPTGMIFVPCEGGISHNEAENARPDDLAKGAAVLAAAMLARAG